MSTKSGCRDKGIDNLRVWGGNQFFWKNGWIFDNTVKVLPYPPGCINLNTFCCYLSPGPDGEHTGLCAHTPDLSSSRVGTQAGQQLIPSW